MRVLRPVLAAGTWIAQVKLLLLLLGHLSLAQVSPGADGLIPPGYLCRVPLPCEQGLVGRPELDQPFHILFGHCRQAAEVKGQQAQTHGTALLRVQVLTLIGVLWEVRQRVGGRLHGDHERTQLGDKEGRKEGREGGGGGGDVLCSGPMLTTSASASCCSYNGAPPSITGAGPCLWAGAAVSSR